MFYSTAGSIVGWIPKHITILKNRPAETGICKQLASLGRFMQRVQLNPDMSSLDEVLIPLKSSLWLGTVLFPI